MWTCTGCGETVEEGFKFCGHCGQARPAVPSASSGTEEVEHYRETKRPDGTITVNVFGQELCCAVCGNKTFRERESLLNTVGLTFLNLDWANKTAMNFICSRCGYIFWFLPQLPQ
jgi:predicted nucleic-acid-binding Zn-ribbon protein